MKNDLIKVVEGNGYVITAIPTETRLKGMAVNLGINIDDVDSCNIRTKIKAKLADEIKMRIVMKFISQLGSEIESFTIEKLKEDDE